MVGDDKTRELLRAWREAPDSAAILTDIDGTLAPIVPTPDQATMPESLRPVLAELAGRLGLLAVVSGRPAAFLGERVRFDAAVPEPVRVACFDPQTSGGLLIAVAPEKTERLLQELEREGVNVRAIIGRVVSGAPGTITIR